MGEKLVNQILAALGKFRFSDRTDATPNGFQVFEQGRDRVDAFRGDPRVLGEALRIFRTADSLPYEYAGVAYTIVAASRESDGSYNKRGLQAAMEWLEKAQDLAPDILAINVIEPLIYIFSGRYDDARIVLDYLHERSGQNYHLRWAELAFWRAQGEMEEAIEWSERAIEAAETVPQRLRVRSVVANLYLSSGQEEKALRSYKEAIHFNPENGWLHHQVARIYWSQEEYDEARRYNDLALDRDPSLEEARRMQAALDEREEKSTGFMGRLFGS